MVELVASKVVKMLNHAATSVFTTFVHIYPQLANRFRGVLERYKENKEATAADPRFVPKVEGLTVLRRALRARRQQAAKI